MKTTNALLTILIFLIGFQKLPLKHKETVSKRENVPIVSVGKTFLQETKTVKAVSDEKENSKHSTTFRQYIDSDSRSNQRVSHNIRIGEDYFVSTGISTRQSTYGDSVGVDASVTKYW
jgi:hypothetical protein